MGAISSYTRISWSTPLVPFAAIVAVTIVCGSLYEQEAGEIQKNALDREARRMEIFARFVQEDLQAGIKDLRQLSDGDGLQTFLLSGQKSDLDRAVHRAWFFSEQNPDYDQVRYLDESGQEVIRVNRHGEIVPQDKLQNDRGRPYFQKAHALERGQFLISAFDLNVENEKIEQPPKPTVRLAMPVYDATGRKRGVEIINYLGANIVSRLQKFTPQYQQRLRILNNRGYWIKAAQPGLEWGFMYPDRAGQTLARTDAGLWGQLASQNEGQVSHGGGYFTWMRVAPRDLLPDSPGSIIPEDDFLVVASELSPKELMGYLSGLQQTFFGVGLVVLILVLLSWSFFHSRRQAQLERDRFFLLSRDLLCVAGFDGYFKRVNPAWAQALGYTTAEILALPFVEFVHPDDVEKTRSVYGGLKKGQEIISFENRYRCKDGSYRWLQWSARPLTGEQLVFASARDLTERKQMEASLKQSEERSRSIIESAHDAFVSIDAEGRIQDWNLQAESIFGWPREEAVGRFLHETIIPERFREAHLRGIRHLHDTGEGPVLNKRIELPALRRDGEEFPAEIAIWPLQRGNETTFHAFIRDITGRKQAEERIQKLSEETKRRADELESSNKELESFSYSVSHDLRAPLRHIHGFVELLQASPSLKADPSSGRYMDVIARAAHQMGLLIDDLLAFSRTGRAKIHPMKIETREMIDEVIQELTAESAGRRVDWEIASLPKVTGDPTLLRLVWTNLLSNALKYTRPRDVAKIEIGYTETPGEVVFFVRDNGVGFDMRYATKLFGVFQRLHRAEDFEGTGIGLANVQRIVFRHGGRVWAESKPDSGATFFFSLALTQNGIPHD